MPWPRIWPPTPAGPPGSLFASSTGDPWGHVRYSAQIWGAVRKRAGLPEGTSTHDLRHRYTSVLLAAGESVVAIAERLGHENATLVLTTYGHLLLDSEDRTRRAIDAVRTTLVLGNSAPATEGRFGRGLNDGDAALASACPAEGPASSTCAGTSAASES